MSAVISEHKYTSPKNNAIRAALMKKYPMLPTRILALVVVGKCKAKLVSSTEAEVVMADGAVKKYSV